MFQGLILSSPRLENKICYTGEMQKVTIDEMMERVSALLWFLKNVKGIEPSLIHCGDA